jgi:hypothetical protein
MQGITMSVRLHLSLKAIVLSLFVAGLCLPIFAEGTLTVKTDPEGIEVWLGDKFIGQSPVIEKKIRAGRYTLKLVDPAQHSSVNEDLLIQDGAPTVVERTISSKFGSLKVTSDPQGIDVYIATELGKTPLSNDFMNPGKYRIELRAPNSSYQTAVSEITVPKGETVSIDQKMQKQPFFTSKNIASLVLLSGAAGCYAWGIIEQGHCRMYQERLGNAPTLTKSAIQDKIDGASLGRTFGVIIGSACLVGLEIVVLF